MATIRAKNKKTISRICAFLSNAGYKVEPGLYGETEIRVDEKEARLRLILQDFIDSEKVSDWILVNGNSVWSYNRIIGEFKKIKRTGSTAGISQYFYEFMHLNFTIAHYDRQGWICTYPGYLDVVEVIKRRRRDIPWWYADLARIADYLISISHKEESGIIKSPK